MICRLLLEPVPAPAAQPERAGSPASPSQSSPPPPRDGGAAARSNRADRFLARIDAYLPTLQSDHARRSFLRQQIAEWELRRQQFILSDGASEPVTDPKDPPDVADFLLTITGLQMRLEFL